jgi:hypothetical protein
MGYKYEEEAELNLIELFWMILDKWKVFVIAGICGMLLMFLYKGVLNTDVVDDGSNYYTHEEVEDMIGESGITRTNIILSKQRNIDSLTEYMGNSYLMRIDPYNVNTLKMQFYIYSQEQNADCEGLQKEIKDLYEQYITSSEFCEKLAEEIGLDDYKYLCELVSTGDGFSVQIANYGIDFSDNSDETHILTIDFIVPNELDEDEIEAAIKRIISGGLDVMNESSFSNVKIKYLSTFHEKKYSNGLYDLQVKLCKAMNTEPTDLSTLKNKLSSMERSFVDGSSVKKNDPLSYKDLIIGLVLGVFISLAVYLASVIFSNQAASVLLGYGALSRYPLIYRVHANRKKNPLTNSAMFASLRNKKYPRIETQVDEMVSAISFYTRNMGDKGSLIAIAEENDSNIDELLKKVPSELKKICFDNSLNDEKEIYNALNGVEGCAVLLIQDGKVNLNKLNKLVEILRVNSVEITGYVSYCG